MTEPQHALYSEDMTYVDVDIKPRYCAVKPNTSYVVDLGNTWMVLRVFRPLGVGKAVGETRGSERTSNFRRSPRAMV